MHVDTVSENDRKRPSWMCLYTYFAFFYKMHSISLYILRNNCKILEWTLNHISFFSLSVWCEKSRVFCDNEAVIDWIEFQNDFKCVQNYVHESFIEIFCIFFVRWKYTNHTNNKYFIFSVCVRALRVINWNFCLWEFCKGQKWRNTHSHTYIHSHCHSHSQECMCSMNYLIADLCKHTLNMAFKQTNAMQEN